MPLEGLHHVTAITGGAAPCIDFYAGVLGLRMVKQTVNYDTPDSYHLYFGDETGSPGSLLTFFEQPGAPPGRHGAGMVHTIRWRVGSEEALDFWAARLAAAGTASERSEGVLGFSDPEGLGHELVLAGPADPVLSADHPEIPSEHALQGLQGACAYASSPDRSTPLLEALGMERDEAGGWTLAGEQRTAAYDHEPPPDLAGLQGAGSVHHIAFCADDETHAEWHDIVARAGARPTEVIDRTYFRSIYFREPSGVLFELATSAPGFAVDEPPEHLGETLQLPPQHEHLRSDLERVLTPLVNPRDPGASA